MVSRSSRLVDFTRRLLGKSFDVRGLTARHGLAAQGLQSPENKPCQHFADIGVIKVPACSFEHLAPGLGVHSRGGAQLATRTQPLPALIAHSAIGLRTRQEPTRTTQGARS